MLAKHVFAAAIRFSGLPWLLRRTHASNKATILLYHDPKPEALDRHLAYLSKRYHFTTLPMLVHAIHAQDWSSMPRRALAITIDDGHRGNAELGDVFRKYGVRPTIYLCSQIVGTLRHFWVDEPCADPGLLQRIKRLPNEERLRICEEETGYTPTREYPESERHALSLEEISQLEEWADIGSHGRFHPILTTCSDEECELEIAGSRRELEAITGLACRDFCYPNGDYTQREVELLKRAQYRSGRGCDGGLNDLRTDPYRLRITSVADDADLNLLATFLTGLLDRVLSKRGGGGWDGVKPPNTIDLTAARRFPDQP